MPSPVSSLEREPDETPEAFSKRTCKLIPGDEAIGSYHVTPKLGEWGLGGKDPEAIARIQAMP
jgi:hypothetical protein